MHIFRIIRHVVYLYVLCVHIMCTLSIIGHVNVYTYYTYKLTYACFSYYRTCCAYYTSYTYYAHYRTCILCISYVLSSTFICIIRNISIIPCSLLGAIYSAAAVGCCCRLLQAAAGCCRLLQAAEGCCRLLQAASCSRSDFRDPTLGGGGARTARPHIYVYVYIYIYIYI